MSAPAAIDPGAYAHLTGIEIEQASAQRTVGSMPVRGNTQTYGLLHGGASAVLAETLASIAACHHWAPGGGVAVGVDLNATHHAAARSGRVTGVALPLHLGRTTASYEVQITDETGRRICTARMTAARRQLPASDGAASNRTGASDGAGASNGASSDGAGR